MPSIYFVRHGKAAAGWDGHSDPELDPLGITQAQLAADLLAPLGPMAVHSSPLARARQTAAPLAEIWEVTPVIEPRVAEIPSPTDNLTERAEWLRGVMAGNWSDLDQRYQDWRNALTAYLQGLQGPTVIFSHFIAINAVVGHILGDDRLVCFRPDNASITELALDNGQLQLIAMGNEAETEVR